MTEHALDNLLKNYMELISRVDEHIQRLGKIHQDRLACKKGCDDCCRHLSLFPVEAFALSRAFDRLDAPCRAKVLGQAKQTDAQCPLLVDHVCMVYEARPIICRTHGYPLYMEKEGKAMVDFCPKNFRGVKKLDHSDMLDLDRMNTLLSAVNSHFTACFEDGMPDRIPVNQALELCRYLV
ncbi:YkgJ family cysteine cluster protein [uncultured Desulfobacter sp.]|uniref:YkgJ family cysteine cluster protein n=1 Tax=uncultured Desulfobacter sp. TaxID=240139 RepID=UPI002AABC348|nr:YkgJ family cysteine cluster protein [uncultured Desulfobacter sp.]